jgi:hypothetical protein
MQHPRFDVKLDNPRGSIGWFWWLNEIVAGTYPFEMISDYLPEESRKYHRKTNAMRK